MTTIALADDHVMLRNGLATLLQKFGYTVLFEASNGNEFMEKLGSVGIPDVALMDINMPEKDGYATTRQLKREYPEIKVLALSMFEGEDAIIRMIAYGARGYVLKEAEPPELKQAIESVVSNGFYCSGPVTTTIIHQLNKIQDGEVDARISLNLNDREMQFLSLVGTEMTYKEIAKKMHVSPRTIDGYRDGLFEKLNIKSRVGLVMFAVRHKLIHVN